MRCVVCYKLREAKGLSYDTLKVYQSNSVCTRVCLSVWLPKVVPATVVLCQSTRTNSRFLCNTSPHGTGVFLFPFEIVMLLRTVVFAQLLFVFVAIVSDNACECKSSFRNRTVSSFVRRIRRPSVKWRTLFKTKKSSVVNKQDIRTVSAEATMTTVSINIDYIISSIHYVSGMLCL